MIVDRLGRAFSKIRFSVTDSCNLRCTYCLPRETEGHWPFLKGRELLTFDEFVRIGRVAADLGVNSAKITGGEPLLRPEFAQLIARLKRDAGLREIALTTNGILLAPLLPSLIEAGLDRVTVSLDSLREERFAAICGRENKLTSVLEGIDAALAQLHAGRLASVKVNMVVVRASNDDEVLAMAERWRYSGAILRYIEFMDVGTVNHWTANRVVSGQELRERIGGRWPLQALPPAVPGETARRWSYVDGGGEVGFIESVSHPFCAACSRLRVGADGKVFLCLFATDGFDLRALLRRPGGISDEELRDTIHAYWAQREDRYSEKRDRLVGIGKSPNRVQMSYIGG
jgi:cyclic pyranopterin phosphate synthase